MSTTAAPAGPVARGVARSTVAHRGAKGLHLVLNLVSTLAIIRNVGHCPHLSSPSACTLAMDGFLADAGI